MAKLSQLQQAYANPNMRKMLNLIASSEGVKHGYNTLFGNQQFNNLAAHPNVRKAFRQTDGATNYTTAAGRYQFLNSTWNNLAKQYGFRDFSPQSQDLGAVALIAQRGALDDVLNGRWESAIGKLGKEWASLPSSTYKQGKRSWDFVNKHLGSNVQIQSYAPEITSAKDTQKLKGQTYFRPQITSKENTARLKGFAQITPSSQQNPFTLEITSPENTLKLKG